MWVVKSCLPPASKKQAYAGSIPKRGQREVIAKPKTATKPAKKRAKKSGDADEEVSGAEDVSDEEEEADEVAEWVANFDKAEKKTASKKRKDPPKAKKASSKDDFALKTTAVKYNWKNMKSPFGSSSIWM